MGKKIELIKNEYYYVILGDDETGTVGQYIGNDLFYLIGLESDVPSDELKIIKHIKI